MYQFMDRSVTPKILYGPKPFRTKYHELFGILYTTDQNYFNWMHYMDILNTNTKTITKMTDTCSQIHRKNGNLSITIKV